MKIEITAEYLASQGLSRKFPQRFWKKVRKTKTCWLWIGDRTTGKWGGYGVIKQSPKRGRIRAHRASWILNFGPIPNGLFVLHNCPNGDTPACINPNHLFLGTSKENMEDACKKGRIRHGEEHFKAKLTTKQVKEIKMLHASGFGCRRLSKRFGVCPETVKSIFRGQTWNHI